MSFYLLDNKEKEKELDNNEYIIPFSICSLHNNPILYFKTNATERSALCFECISSEIKSFLPSNPPHQFIPTSNLTSLFSNGLNEIKSLQSDLTHNDDIKLPLSKLESILSSFLFTQVKKTINNIIFSEYNNFLFYQTAEHCAEGAMLDFLAKKEETKNKMETAKCFALNKLRNMQEILLNYSDELSERINSMLREFFIFRSNDGLNSIKKEGEMNAPPCSRIFFDEECKAPLNKKPFCSNSRSSCENMILSFSKLVKCNEDKRIIQGCKMNRNYDNNNSNINYERRITFNKEKYNRKIIRKCLECKKNFCIWENEMKWKLRCKNCYVKFSKIYNNENKKSNMISGNYKYQNVNSFKRDICDNYITTEIDMENKKEENRNIQSEIEIHLGNYTVCDFGNDSDKNDSDDNL